MDLGLQGRRAIVTGGSRGIGRAIAETLLAEGASIAICARTPEGVDEAKRDMQGLGSGSVFAAPADVGDADQLRGFVEAAIDAMGGLDILVHNPSAGGGGAGVEGWRNTFNVDVLGGVLGVEAALPALESSDAASIVFIGTTASMEVFGQPSAYGPMKAAMRAYCNELGQSLAPKGIRVNVVSPGSIYFEGGGWHRVEQGMPEYFQSVLSTIPMGRLGTPEEVARVVVFLASPAASWITGTNVVVDGGQHKSVD